MAGYVCGWDLTLVRTLCNDAPSAKQQLDCTPRVDYRRHTDAAQAFAREGLNWRSSCSHRSFNFMRCKMR